MAAWALYILFWFLYAETSTRAKLRCKILHCKLNYNNTTILDDPYDMWSDPLTQLLMSQHNNYTKSYDCMTWTHLGFELRQIGNNPWVLIYFGLLATSFFNCCVTGFAIFLSFYGGLIYNYGWLEQIHEQVKDCINLLERLNHIERNMHMSNRTQLISKWHYYCATGQNVINNEQWVNQLNAKSPNCCYYSRQIQKALMITYLNFELFRNEFRTTRQMCNLNLLQYLPVPILNSILCTFWTGSSLSKHIKMDIYQPLLQSIVYISFMNWLIICSDILHKKVQKLYKSVDLLVTKLISNSMELEYIHELWSKQLMSETDITHYYCPQILGNYLSSSILIGINSYAFALWLVTGRYFDTTQDSLYDV